MRVIVFVLTSILFAFALAGILDVESKREEISHPRVGVTLHLTDGSVVTGDTVVAPNGDYQIRIGTKSSRVIPRQRIESVDIPPAGSRPFISWRYLALSLPVALVFGAFWWWLLARSSDKSGRRNAETP